MKHTPPSSLKPVSQKEVNIILFGSMSVSLVVLLVVAHFTGHLSSGKDIFSASVVAVFLIGLAFLTRAKPHWAKGVSFVLLALLAIVEASAALSGHWTGTNTIVTFILFLSFLGNVFSRKR